MKTYHLALLTALAALFGSALSSAITVTAMQSDTISELQTVRTNQAHVVGRLQAVHKLLNSHDMQVANAFTAVKNQVAPKKWCDVPPPVKPPKRTFMSLSDGERAIVLCRRGHKRMCE